MRVPGAPFSSLGHPRGWGSPRAPLEVQGILRGRGTPWARHPSWCGSREAPPRVGGRWSPPPRCPGPAPAACQAVGARTAPHSASPGRSRQRGVPVRVCSHPPARVSHTLATRPQTDCEHPKAGFEKCSSVPAGLAAGSAALPPRTDPPIRPPRCSDLAFNAGQHNPKATAPFFQGQTRAWPWCRAHHAPQSASTRGKHTLGMLGHCSAPLPAQNAAPCPPWRASPSTRHPLGHRVGLHTGSVLTQPSIQHRNIRIVQQTQTSIDGIAACCSWPEQAL